MTRTTPIDVTEAPTLVDQLRRLFGREPATTTPTSVVLRPDVDADENARDLDLLRDEQSRLDELAQRQLRYADYAWEPPAQGGSRRADDAEEKS